MSKKIVIVEDQVPISDIYKTRLELAGYHVVQAYDGIAALYIIRQEKPDLVLLDLMVPAIAGDEVLKRMRRTDWGKEIPVLIVSNLNEADAPAGIREQGIEDYLVKAELKDNDLDKIVINILDPPEPKPRDDNL
jgi:DNA-binding response OmpR family regulator